MNEDIYLKEKYLFHNEDYLIKKPDIQCLQCGKCCHYLVKGKITKCPHLIKLKNGKTKCRVYYTRLGRPIGHGQLCGMRSQGAYDFEGCPYNTNKPLFGGGKK